MNLLKKHNAQLFGDGIEFKNGKKTGRETITFVVKEKTDNPKGQLIPKEINGKPTDVIEADLKALSSPDERQEKFEELKGGISIGCVFTGAGTLGIVAYYENHPCIVSNAHVIAPHWNGAKIGHPIIQPGINDGLMNGGFNEVGYLVDYKAIDFTGKANKIDTGIGLIDFPAKPLYIEGIGDIKPESKRMELGDKMKQSGRTSVIDTEEVIVKNATARVNYGDKTAYWEDQVLLKNKDGYVKAGDSGSVIIHEDNTIGGLIFGGGDKYAVANQFDNVLKEFPKLSLKKRDYYIALHRDWTTDTRAKVNGLNIRTEPKIGENKAGRLNKGQKINIKKYAGYADGNHWVKIEL